MVDHSTRLAEIMLGIERALNLHWLQVPVDNSLIPARLR